MGRKSIDLQGKQFGSLLVLERDYENPDKQHTYWFCQCQNCGKIKSVRGSSLNSGEIKSCACVRETRTNDLTNQQFGYWTVLERDMDSAAHKRNKYHSVYWKCRCKCGTIKSIRADSLIDETSLSCGCVKFSKGENKITQILKENDIEFETQKIFDSCRFPKSNVVARFDFYLKKYNTIIEYDGKQHFESSEIGWDTKQNLDKTIERDQYKNQWCKKHNIYLIRIPYFYYNNLSLQDLMPKTSPFLYKGE